MCVVGVWQRDFFDCNTKRNVKFVRYSSKIANLDNNGCSIVRSRTKSTEFSLVLVDLGLPCGVCAWCDELRTTVRGSSL